MAPDSGLGWLCLYVYLWRKPGPRSSPDDPEGTQTYYFAALLFLRGWFAVVTSVVDAFFARRNVAGTFLHNRS